MSGRRAPTRAAHQRFCERDQWTLRKSARGKRSDHERYELVLDDGAVLYTRISHPPDKTTYGAEMWSFILRTQLQVTEDEFWDCVDNGVRPRRGKYTVQAERQEQLPAWLVAQLIKADVPEDDVRSLSTEEAQERLEAIRATPSGSDDAARAPRDQR